MGARYLHELYRIQLKRWQQGDIPSFYSLNMRWSVNLTPWRRILPLCLHNLAYIFVVFLCCMQDSNPIKVSDTYSPADWMPADKPTELSRIKLKNLKSTARPYDQQHSAHSTPLPVGFRPWLWRNTYLLLLISMLWHRQAIFESKGDKLSSSAECRIRTQGLRHTCTHARIHAHIHRFWQFEYYIPQLCICLSLTLWNGTPIARVIEILRYLTNIFSNSHISNGKSEVFEPDRIVTKARCNRISVICRLLCYLRVVSIMRMSS